MEYKVYRLRIEKKYKDVDMDMCPTTTWETTFEDTYASKVAAVRLAQRHFAKSGLGRYTLAVHASVWRYTISDKGMGEGKRVYNLYKELDHDIYGNIKE